MRRASGSRDVCACVDRRGSWGRTVVTEEGAQRDLLALWTAFTRLLLKQRHAIELKSRLALRLRYEQLEARSAVGRDPRGGAATLFPPVPRRARDAMRVKLQQARFREYVRSQVTVYVRGSRSSLTPRRRRWARGRRPTCASCGRAELEPGHPQSQQKGPPLDQSRDLPPTSRRRRWRRRGRPGAPSRRVCEMPQSTFCGLWSL